ncbi:hypothetical protein [Gluconobacter sp. P5B12]|uniref:hypothetical protein n=1 Tax=Gluconobacter sp. P5B12 TaxID=2762618 RepID=UPI00207B60E6|nr:hypothetical protein [Gluconobacter sp. P5B12]
MLKRGVAAEAQDERFEAIHRLRLDDAALTKMGHERHRGAGEVALTFCGGGRSAERKESHVDLQI